MEGRVKVREGVRDELGPGVLEGGRRAMVWEGREGRGEGGLCRWQGGEGGEKGEVERERGEGRVAKGEGRDWEVEVRGRRCLGCNG